jgi:O-antigen ligase
MFFYTSVAAFLFSAIALVVPSGHSIGAVMMTLGSIVLVWKRPRLRLNKKDWKIIHTFVFYFAVALIFNLIHGEKLREYDGPFRFVLAIGALLLLLACPPNPRAFWSGVAIGAILSGIFAGWQVFFQGKPRALGYTTTPIQYCNICLLLGILCLAGFMWSRYQRHAKVWAALFSIGALMAIFAAILTGSRGSWIALPVCLIALYQFSQAGADQRVLIRIVATIAALFAIAYAIPSTGVKARMGLIPTETKEYFKAGEAETSLGARFEMWRFGLSIFPEHPLLGWGKSGYMAHAAELAKAGKIAPVVTQHSHLHDDFLDALVKRGVLGLAAVVALYLVPLLLFINHAKSKSNEERTYAIAGMLLCLSYVSFGLTDSFLTHDDGVMVFAFMSVLLWAELRHAAQLPPGLEK